MLDTSKYARDFPGDNPQPDSPSGGGGTVAPTAALLAALHKLEKEFSEILRAQSGQSDGSA
jgi:hypothetical protein